MGSIYSDIYRNSEHYDEYMEQIKNAGLDEELAEELYQEMEYKYSEK